MNPDALDQSDEGNEKQVSPENNEETPALPPPENNEETPALPPSDNEETPALPPADDEETPALPPPENNEETPAPLPSSSETKEPHTDNSKIEYYAQHLEGRKKCSTCGKGVVEWDEDKGIYICDNCGVWVSEKNFKALPEIGEDPWDSVKKIEQQNEKDDDEKDDEEEKRDVGIPGRCPVCESSNIKKVEDEDGVHYECGKGHYIKSSDLLPEKDESRFLGKGMLSGSAVSLGFSIFIPALIFVVLSLFGMGPFASVFIILSAVSLTIRNLLPIRNPYNNVRPLLKAFGLVFLVIGVQIFVGDRPVFNLIPLLIGSFGIVSFAGGYESFKFEDDEYKRVKGVTKMIYSGTVGILFLYTFRAVFSHLELAAVMICLVVAFFLVIPDFIADVFEEDKKKREAKKEEREDQLRQVVGLGTRAGAAAATGGASEGVYQGAEVASQAQNTMDSQNTDSNEGGNNAGD